MRADVRPGRKPWPMIMGVMAAAFSGLATATEPLRSIAEIMALPPDELRARRPVVIRGVVTLANPLVIQDGDHAIGLAGGDSAADETARFRPPVEPPPALGTEFEVSGFVDAGSRAPTVTVESIRQLGMRPLPEPVPLDPARFFAGRFAWRRIKTAGVVQAVLDNPEGWSLIFEAAGRRFRILIGKRLMPSRPERLIDADVEIVGVDHGVYNNRSEFVAPRIEIASPDDVRVVRSPPLPAWELPVATLGAIARFRLEAPEGHRVRTTGIVSFAVPGTFYLAEGAGGVRVELAPDPGSQQVFEAGDRVDVAGFLDVNSGIGALTWAVARTVSPGPAPAAVPVQPSTVLRVNEASYRSEQRAAPGNYEGCLVRCTGRVEAVNHSPLGTVLTLSEQGGIGRSTALSQAIAGRRLAVVREFGVHGSDDGA